MMSMHKRAGTVIAGIFLTGLVLVACEYTHGAALDTVKKGDFVLKPDISYKAGDVKDPFKSCLPEPPVPVPGAQQEDIEVKLPELKISGIFWGAEFPQAIINGAIVKVGDTVLDAKIISIAREGVTVTFHRRDYLLTAPASQNLDTARSKKEALHE